MTKNEATINGRNAGIAHAAMYLGNPDALSCERILVKTYVTDYASTNVAKGPQKQPLFDAFVDAFMATWDRAYLAQPHVIARRRVTRLLDYCESQVRTGNDTIATFVTRLTEDRWDAAFNAFEWADNAAEAAANIQVAKRVIAWYETAQNVDTVLTEVRNAVQRGARFPSHSTSPLTNQMKQNELAAYAAVLEACDR